MSDTKAKVIQAAQFLRGRFTFPWSDAIFVVLGSGFKNFADSVDVFDTIECQDIPYFRSPKVVGHGSKIILSTVEGRPCVIATGRIHMYEGYSASDAVFGIRVMRELGINAVVLTNAAGSVNLTRKPGEALVLADHLNLSGKNCLVDDGQEFGPQFVDMVNAYDNEWRERIVNNSSARPGVYAGLLGPNYETPAETKMLGILGADVVGMSTVQETLAARQLGMKVAALSLITNYAGGLAQSVNHQEVLETGKQRAAEMLKILTIAVANAPN